VFYYGSKSYDWTAVEGRSNKDFTKTQTNFIHSSLLEITSKINHKMTMISMKFGYFHNLGYFFKVVISNTSVLEDVLQSETVMSCIHTNEINQKSHV